MAQPALEVCGVVVAGSDPSVWAMLASAVGAGEDLRFGDHAVRLSEEPDGEGLTALQFRAPGPDDAARLLQRRGLAPVPGQDCAAFDVGGLRIQVLEDRPGPAPQSCAITGLDHVVVFTADAQRAAADWGARLGLDLRLDRDAPQWGGRMLFLRCGPVVIEVVAALDEPGPDRWGGIAWRVSDLDRVREALVAAGIEVSPVRTGRKPGTRVCTVKDRRFATAQLLLAID